MNCSKTGIGTRNAVGCFANGKSPYGCEEMSGNVWEWTRSLWGEDWQKPEFNYPYDPNDSRENLKAPDNVIRVLRGGAFNNNPNDVRGAVRNRNKPDNRNNNIGFRLVVSTFIERWNCLAGRSTLPGRGKWRNRFLAASRVYRAGRIATVPLTCNA
jgi:hypothetical protein